MASLVSAYTKGSSVKVQSSNLKGRLAKAYKNMINLTVVDSMDFYLVQRTPVNRIQTVDKSHPHLIAEDSSIPKCKCKHH